MIKRVLIIFVILSMLILCSTLESTYARKGIVINNKNGIVTVEDGCGYLWEYKGIATVGDTVTLIMYDNHTGNIYDDIIKEVKQ